MFYSYVFRSVSLSYTSHDPSFLLPFSFLPSRANLFLLFLPDYFQATNIIQQTSECSLPCENHEANACHRVSSIASPMTSYDVIFVGQSREITRKSILRRRVTQITIVIYLHILQNISSKSISPVFCRPTKDACRCRHKQKQRNAIGDLCATANLTWK